MRRTSCSILALGLLLAALLRAADEPQLPRGTRELALNGAIYVTHDAPEDLFGTVTVRGGYYFARNHQVGAAATVFAYSRIQDVYLSGYYRYVFAGAGRHFAPYLGAAAGANVARFNQIGGEHSLIVMGQAGIRCLITPKSALDIGYDFMYRNNAEIGFTGTTSSILTFGFVRTF